MIVLDASAALELAMQRKHSLDIAKQLRESREVWVPDIFYSEVANAFWKSVAFADFDPERARVLLRLTVALPDHVEKSSALTEGAFSLSCQRQKPVYDSLYLELARIKAAKLLTMDRKLANECRRLGVQAYRPSDLQTFRPATYVKNSMRAVAWVYLAPKRCSHSRHLQCKSTFSERPLPWLLRSSS